MMYIDILLVQNLVYDYLILCSVAILTHQTLSFVKTGLALSCGVVSSTICFIFNFDMLLSLIPCLMVYLTFKPLKKGLYLKCLLYFYCVSIMISGSLYMLTSLLSFSLTPATYLMVILILVIGVTILYLACATYLSENTDLYQLSYEVEVLVSHQVIIGIGYVDTGNQLRDHVTSEPVLLVPRSLLCEGDVEQYLTDRQVKWWYTTYQVVNEAPKSIRVFRPTCLMIQNEVVSHGLVGIVEGSFSSFDFLLQPMFVKGIVAHKGGSSCATFSSKNHSANN